MTQPEAIATFKTLLNDGFGVSVIENDKKEITEIKVTQNRPADKPKQIDTQAILDRLNQLEETLNVVITKKGKK